MLPGTGLMLSMTLATATGLARQVQAEPPLECQPRSGAHLHTPLYHIIGRMLPTATGGHWPLGATDGNAVFAHRGVFHVMHQTPNRTSSNPATPTTGYWASWGHVVSTDGAHWRRIANALDPGFNSSYDWHDGDCDGTVSFLPEDQVDGGVVMTFGPDCARGVSRAGSSSGGGATRRQLSTDAPRVGLARLADPSSSTGVKPLLDAWKKDKTNPIEFGQGSPPCAFSGKIWREPADTVGGGAAAAADGTTTSSNSSMVCAVNSLRNAWCVSPPLRHKTGTLSLSSLSTIVDDFSCALHLGGPQGPLHHRRPEPAWPVAPGRPVRATYVYRSHVASSATHAIHLHVTRSTYTTINWMHIRSFATYHGSVADKPWPCTDASAVPPCPVGSISDPSFLPLPPYKGPQTYTHMINAGGGRAYILGVYDPKSLTLNASGPIQTVESSGSGANWYVAGVGTSQSKRVLHVGFFEPRDGRQNISSLIEPVFYFTAAIDMQKSVPLWTLSLQAGSCTTGRIPWNRRASRWVYAASNLYFVVSSRRSHTHIPPCSRR